MITSTRVDGVETCRAAHATSDPWIPLTVRWGDDTAGLSLYVRDARLGHVKIGVDSDSGALRRLVVITLPRRVERELGSAPVRPDVVPVLDREMWPWKETPDYRELTFQHIDATADLAYSVSGERFTVWLSGEPVHELLSVGDVRVGLAPTRDLLCVDVPLACIDAIWWT